MKLKARPITKVNPKVELEVNDATEAEKMCGCNHHGNMSLPQQQPNAFTCHLCPYLWLLAPSSMMQMLGNNYMHSTMALVHPRVTRLEDS